MSQDKTNIKTVISAALVSAAVSAAGIGLFVANQPAPTGDSQMAKVEAARVKAAPDKQGFSDAEKSSIEQLVRGYLMNNPEILVEISAELERRQTEAQDASRATALKENADDIFRGPNDLVAGNPKGDVTVVEFFDYNCGFCKRAFPALVKLLETDPNVRVVLKEFPIFGERSAGAARVAIAARHQGKYFELHAEMLKQRGQVTEASALRAAEKLGLDMDKLKSDMKRPDVEATINDTRTVAEKLGIRGTPFYLVGDKVIPGAPDNLYELFAQNVAEIRKNGCTVAC